MKNNDTTAIHNEMASFPTVRIDALDELFIQPLREFFAINGCKVYINSSPSAQCTYHLVVGDITFVKTILGTQTIFSQKTMAVIWDIYEEDVVIPNGSHIKVALIDPKTISGDLLGALCNFFFTGTQKIKNFQTTTPTRIKQPTSTKQINEERPKQREPQAEHRMNEKRDTQRIAQTISQEFQSDTQSKHHQKKWVFISIGCICISLTLPLIVYLGSLTLLTASLYTQSMCMKKTEMCTFKTNIYTRQWVRTARGAFSIIQLPLRLTKQSDIIAKNETIISTLEKMTAVLASSAEINLVASNFITSFLTTDLSKQDTVSAVVQIEQMKTQLFSLHTNLDLSYRMLEQIIKDPPFLLSIPLFTSRLEQGMITLKRVRTNMQTAERLLLLYPYISGYKQPLTLLVLLQNNTELRPTGGFIGSIMHITIEDGAITDMRVEDVYTVDGQLKGHVDPPIPIRDLLTQEHWYLRDSNWNPDFTESAEKAMWFYEKETGSTVNGVIALNASLIVKFLKLTGPVKLLDGGDEIREDNFYAKSLQYTQTDFFPGSTQKKDFLGNLMKTLMATIFQNKKISGVQLFETMDQALRERDVQMYFTDHEAQQLAEQFEWAGKLPTKQLCEPVLNAVCLFQFYGVIEANLGVNKANYYIERNDTRDITIDASGRVRETVTRVIKNTANDQPGGGIYKNYMRFYLPKSAHITAFTINSVSVPAKATGKNALIVLPYGELDTTTHALTTIVASAFDVLPQQEVAISVTYEYLNRDIAIEHDIRMIVFSQKQSGVTTVPTLIRVHYPYAWRTKGDGQTNTITVANNGYLEYNSTMLQDSSIQIHFLKD
ncbi:MAG: DUF4012 domain-containing protein [Candidatus Gottesmanbacteria bacterium]